ncbi:dipeptidase [Halobacillus seohaensis]|uniref:Dipeptidase n=1 Tax=Halobacillus seohaensis TaxID=447421 RepID=A0ABW2EPB4_9BACI
MTYPILDGHNDTLLNFHMKDSGKGRSFFEESSIGHIDYPRAKKGGFSGGFFAIFPPPNASLSVPKPEHYLTEDGYDIPLPEAANPEACYKVTNEMMQLLYQIEADSKGCFSVVKNIPDLKKALENKQMAAILHFEGAEVIDPDIKNLVDFYNQGLRSLGLVWSRPNAFAQGVPYRYPSTPDIGPGLTLAGKELVEKCNELGIMLDTSHLNEKGFWDVVEYSNAPIVATHSNAHTLCPISRNLTDKQLDAIAHTDGVVGVTYSVNMLRPDGKMNKDTSLDDIVRHIRYITDQIGVEHVALGSDFDGTTLPNDMKDVTGVPKVIKLLEEDGFSMSDLKKITHENWIRVLTDTWK